MLDEKRRSLDESTLTALHFLNWNLQLKCAIEKEKESLEEPVIIKPKCKRPRKPPSSANYYPRLWSLKQKSHSTSDTEGQLPVQGVSGSKRKNEDTQSLPTIAQKKDSRKPCSDLSQESINPNYQPPAGAETHGNVHSANCKQSLNRLHPQHGLPQDTAALFNKSQTVTEPYVLPAHKKSILNALLDNAVSFRGSNKIDEQDLDGLHGHKESDEGKFLSNFVIEAYFDLISTKAMSKSVQVECLDWEIFENGVGSKPTQAAKLHVLKRKGNLMEQDFVLVPCNVGKSKHWFLLAVLPKQKQILILDSKAAASVKQAAYNAVKKMWALLQEFDNKLQESQWQFFSNSPTEIPQQQNGYDCGVYICLFARCLIFPTEFVILQQESIEIFRQQMILELHEKELHSFNQLSIEKEHFYVVEYLKSFYFGRALNICELGGGFVDFKFLHSTGAQLFNWPRRDDIDRVHSSCVFYGPVRIEGFGPFSILQQNEVKNVYNWLKKSRKDN